MGSNCQGKPLGKDHNELYCHAQGEKRSEILKLLNCWVNTIEGNCPIEERRESESCEGYVLCFPEFSCTKGRPVNKPRCTNTTTPQFHPDQSGRSLPVWSRDKPPIPPWERPRVKSSQLVAGYPRKVADCFRANGLNDLDYCPRTESCELMRCFNQMIEEDRRIHGRKTDLEDCCCKPGDKPSRIPQFKCSACPPYAPFVDYLRGFDEYHSERVNNGHHEEKPEHNYESKPSSHNGPNLHHHSTENCRGNFIRPSKEIWREH